MILLGTLLQELLSTKSSEVLTFKLLCIPGGAVRRARLFRTKEEVEVASERLSSGDWDSALYSGFEIV